MRGCKKVDKSRNNYNNNRITYDRNHIIIMEAYDKLYESTGQIPTLQAIAKETKMAYATVHKHCSKLTLDYIKPRFKVASERVIKKLLANIEERGNAAEVKLFNQLINDYKEKNETNLTFNEDEAKQKIEDMFLK